MINFNIQPPYHRGSSVRRQTCVCVCVCVCVCACVCVCVCDGLFILTSIQL